MVSHDRWSSALAQIDALADQGKEVKEMAKNAQDAMAGQGGARLIGVEYDENSLPVRLTLTGEGWRATSDELAVEVSREIIGTMIGDLLARGAQRPDGDMEPVLVRGDNGCATVEVVAGVPVRIAFVPGVDPRRRWNEVSRDVVGIIRRLVDVPPTKEGGR
ncbi:MAG: hypothetical protein FWD18_04980 [Micrococcales bacterium]|nr:hypothetical protein [Micrococcales bacterium]